MKIRIFQLKNGRVPFTSWLEQLKDQRVKAKILVWLDRIKTGNSGDIKSVGDGVSELRIHQGKGYRVDLACEGNAAVLLLCGDNKTTQQKDIIQAEKYWKEYNVRIN